MNKHALQAVAATLLLAIIAVVGFKLAPQLKPAVDVRLPVSPCDPGRQACTARLPDGGELTFSISPRPITPLRPLSLEVTLKGSRAQKVEVDFDGSEMRMGYNRPQLDGESQRFLGQTTLPVCITGNMTWVATVLLSDEKQRIAIPFHFSLAAR